MVIIYAFILTRLSPLGLPREEAAEPSRVRAAPGGSGGKPPSGGKAGASAALWLGYGVSTGQTMAPQHCPSFGFLVCLLCAIYQEGQKGPYVESHANKGTKLGDLALNLGVQSLPEGTWFNMHTAFIVTAT